MSPRSTPFEVLEDIYQVVFDGISDNVASLVQYDKYDAIDTSDTTTNGYYVITFISEAYALRNNTTIYGQVTSERELVAKAQYLFSIL